MPIPVATPLTNIPAMFPARIAAYNVPGSRTAGYNLTYNRYITDRAAGIAAGGLATWIAGGGAVIAIQSLLTNFGMNARNSVLVPDAAFQATLVGLHAPTINWISGLSLPLAAPPPVIINPVTGASLAADMNVLFNALQASGAVSVSGGYVAASKTLHCLFPNLTPMIDGEHTGLSYYHIVRATYTPPLGLGNWDLWVGATLRGVPNPSPRGAGRAGWDWTRFAAAIGINQHIYELWQANNGYPGLPAFLAMDPTPGTTGIPKIIDKVLW